MPTPAQTAKVMIFNRNNKVGKHYTNAEIQKRQQAEEKLRRSEVKLKMPAFLKERACAPAQKIWKEMVKEGLEIGLFDNVDARVLADFCRYQALLEEELGKSFPNSKLVDRLGKLVLSYAEKLGLTPTARARLVIKRADADNENNNLLDEMMA